MELIYNLAGGRTITKNGTAIAQIIRIFNGNEWTLSPIDADMLAHRIVNALNDMEWRKEADSAQAELRARKLARTRKARK